MESGKVVGHVRRALRAGRNGRDSGTVAMSIPFFGLSLGSCVRSCRALRSVRANNRIRISWFPFGWHAVAWLSYVP